MLNILHYQQGLCKPMSRTGQYGTQTTVNKLELHRMLHVILHKQSCLIHCERKATMSQTHFGE